MDNKNIVYLGKKESATKRVFKDALTETELKEQAYADPLFNDIANQAKMESDAAHVKKVNEQIKAETVNPARRLEKMMMDKYGIRTRKQLRKVIKKLKQLERKNPHMKEVLNDAANFQTKDPLKDVNV